MEKKISLMILFFLIFIRFLSAQKNNYLGIGLNNPFVNIADLGITYRRDSLFNSKKINFKANLNFDLNNKTEFSQKNIFYGGDMAFLYCIKSKNLNNHFLIGPAFYTKYFKNVNLTNSIVEFESKNLFNGIGLKAMIAKKIKSNFYLNIEIDQYYGKFNKENKSITNGYSGKNNYWGFNSSKFVAISIQFNF